LIAALGATVLAHNWGLFLVAAILIAGVLTGARAGRGDRARVAALAAGGVAVLYAAWVPTLLAQVAHTGAPWALAPDLGDLAGTAAGGLGGTGPALLLLAGGLLCVVRLRRQTPPVVALMAVSAVGVVTFAFVASQVEPAWAGRYVAVAVGPLVLMVACLLARSATLGLAALMVVSILGLTDPRTHQLEHKDNVRAVAAWLRTTGLDAADVVVSAHPERGPVLYHYLGRGPRYADLLGPVDDPRAFDWRDAFDRLERPAPARIAGDLVASIRPGSLLVLMVPEVRGSGWSAPWTRLVRARSLAWERLLIADVRLRRLGAVPGATGAPRPRSVFAVVFRRVA
jgi:hypothetical protein